MKKIFCIIIVCALPISTYSKESSKIDIGIVEKRGRTIDLSHQFTDEAGKTNPLSIYFKRARPVIVIPVYYKCTQLCTITLSSLHQILLKEKSLVPYQDYEIVIYSINPQETPALAKQKKEKHINSLNLSTKKKTLYNKGMHFLTGSAKSIASLSNELGFYYQKEGKEFSHAGRFIFLNPHGKIKRYLRATTPSIDYYLALLEASSGKVGSFIDAVAKYFFYYDYAFQKYKLVPWKVAMAIGAIFLSMVSLVFALLLRMRLKKS